LEGEKMKNDQGDKNLLEGEFANEFKQIKQNEKHRHHQSSFPQID